MIPQAKPPTEPAGEVVPFPTNQVTRPDLDEFAENLIMVPDDIMLAYIVSRYTQAEILEAYNS